MMRNQHHHHHHHFCCWIFFAAAALLVVGTTCAQDTADTNTANTAETCSSTGSCSSNEEYRDHILQCGVYMAPSTLGNASNLGIFTAKPLEANDVINFPELVIPLAFRDWGEMPKAANGDGDLWDRYIWEGAVGNIEAFDTYDRTIQRSIFVPGVGCTINSVLDLNNLYSTHGSEYDPVVDRSHPAAGSFSPYHASLTTTTRAVPAGGELFADYGDSWIPWIPNIPILQDPNLDGADDLLKDFAQWTQEMKGKHGEEAVSDELLDRLYQLTRTFPHYSSIFTVLPPKIEDWKTLESLETREYWRSKYQVSVEWLQTSDQAKCQDHMRPGRSTIPHAGRGAFATRFLPKGSVVGYAPLIHVVYVFDDVTQVPTSESNSNNAGAGKNDDDDDDDKARAAKKHPDLVWNYSFGHPNSTLVFTPYGGMVNYINHALKEKANVRVQWPKNQLVAHKPEWLNKDLDFIRHSLSGVGLSFDYVALRDIQEGEEIFMDYGEEWQAAWEEHVKNWRVPEDEYTYMHSSQYQVNELKTPAELREDPYPSNLVTICAESYRLEDGKYVFIPILRDWNIYVPCEVLSKVHGKKYTVKLTKSDNENITVYNVPYPQGVKLVDRAYSQDWHLPNAFRHKIMIPDDLFPAQWRNLE